MRIKKFIRQDRISARKSLTPEERELFSGEISGKLLVSEHYKNSDTIMLYQAMPGEVDLNEFSQFAKANGKRLCYPKCISKTEMVALEPQEDVWNVGAFGIKEPNLELSELIQPEEIDLIICPCTAFDENCNRLGMGAGYYDRFLEKCTKAHIVAVAFEIQKADSIPMDEYDKIMDSVFTEKRIYVNGLKGEQDNEFYGYSKRASVMP